MSLDGDLANTGIARMPGMLDEFVRFDESEGE
jgi:hypothetical protein